MNIDVDRVGGDHGDPLLALLDATLSEKLAHLLAGAHRIADDRMLEVRHVHADLVRAAGFQAAFQRGVRAEAFAQAVMRDRVAPIVAQTPAADSIPKMLRLSFSTSVVRLRRKSPAALLRFHPVRSSA